MSSDIVGDDCIQNNDKKTQRKLMKAPSLAPLVFCSSQYIMATYFISVHALLQRLNAEQEVDEEHDCHSEACLENVEFDSQRATRLKMIERKAIDVRSTSCPAATTTTRQPQRVDR